MSIISKKQLSVKELKKLWLELGYSAKEIETLSSKVTDFFYLQYSKKINVQSIEFEVATHDSDGYDLVLDEKEFEKVYKKYQSLKKKNPECEIHALFDSNEQVVFEIFQYEKPIDTAKTVAETIFNAVKINTQAHLEQEAKEKNMLKELLKKYPEFKNVQE